MANHPNRVRESRTVTVKIVEGGGMVRCSDGTTSELAIRVSDVPSSVRDADVLIQLRKVVLLPTGGPWLVSWPRIADARQGAIIRNCH